MEKKLKWYALKVRGGHENKIKEAMEKAVAQGGVSDFFGSVFVPQRKDYRIKDGKRKMVAKNMGYLFLQAEIKNSGMRELVRELEGTQGFLTTSGYSFSNEPQEIPPAEIDSMAGRISHSNAMSQTRSADLVVGDRVQFIGEGYFPGSEGVVASISKNNISVDMKLFDRSTRVVTTANKIEKIDK